MDRPIRPIVIAHRGASGYLPEHTLAAKALAYAMGADYLEQDVVATADDQLVVLHDIHVDRVSNVARVFPGRCRADGRYYVRDFTLSELARLQLHERTNDDGSAVYPERFPVATLGGDEIFRINTLAGELAFVDKLRGAIGRPVGIYPEIKRPQWHREEGVDITALCLETLAAAGFSERHDPVYLQCFDAEELRRVRHELGCDLKLIQLIGENAWRESPTNFDRLRSKRGMLSLAKTVDGIGPWINRLYRYNHSSRSVRDSGLVRRAHEAGLAVHPYTVRRDALPRGFAGIEELLGFLFGELNVDGVFTDFPEIRNHFKKVH